MDLGPLDYYYENVLPAHSQSFNIESEACSVSKLSTGYDQKVSFQFTSKGVEGR